MILRGADDSVNGHLYATGASPLRFQDEKLAHVPLFHPKDI